MKTPARHRQRKPETCAAPGTKCSRLSAYTITAIPDAALTKPPRSTWRKEMIKRVLMGKMDFMLLLPINTRFIISLRQVDLGGFVNAASGIAVMVYALNRLHFVPGAAQVSGFLCLCLAGVFIHYSLMFLLASISFWTVRAQGIIWAYYTLFTIA